MNFGTLQTTKAGKNLLAKAQIGATLTFTRAEIGNGSLGSQNPLLLTTLIAPLHSLPLTGFKNLGDGTAAISTGFTNTDFETGFYLRELGLYAMDPDLGEILYCYSNADVLAEYIPSNSEGEVIERKMNLITLITDVQSVQVTLDQSLIYSMKDHVHDGTDEAKVDSGNVTFEDDAGNLVSLDVKSALTEVGSSLKAFTAGEVPMEGPLETPNVILNRPLISDGIKTYYVDYASGSDLNDGLTALTAFKTWGKVQSLLPFFLRHNYSVVIIGNYPQDIVIQNIVSSNNGVVFKITTDDLIAVNHVIKRIFVANVSMPTISFSEAFLSCMEITEGLFIYNSTGAVDNLRLRNTAGYGIDVYSRSAITVGNSDFSTCLVGIRSLASKVYSYSNTGACVNYGLFSDSGGEIHKPSAGGTQPTGGSANEIDNNVSILSPETVITSGFASGWSGEIRFEKTSRGQIEYEIVNLIKTTDIGAADVPFTFAVGHRPSRQVKIKSLGLDASNNRVYGSNIEVVINTSGQLVLANSGSITANVRGISGYKLRQRM